MANVVITIRVMPDSVDVNVDELKVEVLKEIKRFTGQEEDKNFKVTINPVAFGLKAVDVIFVHDEKKGGTDPLEDILRNMDGVGGVEILDVRRAMG